MARIGDLGVIDLTDPELFRDGPPHDAFRRLRDQAPLFWHEPTATTPDGEGFWCLTRHEDVAWAAKNQELFSSAGGGERDGGGTLIEDLPAGFAAGVLFNMQDDPRHHHIRRLVTPSVSPKQLRVITTDTASLVHPIGTLTDSDQIRDFYRDVVLAGQAVLTIGDVLADGDLVMAEIAATSPLDPSAGAAHAIDVFRLAGDGRIERLEIYYR